MVGGGKGCGRVLPPRLILAPSYRRYHGLPLPLRSIPSAASAGPGPAPPGVAGASSVREEAVQPQSLTLRSWAAPGAPAGGRRQARGAGNERRGRWVLWDRP